MYREELIEMGVQEVPEASTGKAAQLIKENQLTERQFSNASVTCVLPFATSTVQWTVRAYT